MQDVTQPPLPSPPPRTGEILVGEGLISHEDVNRVLAIQEQGRARPLSNTNRLFGMILCDLNLITPLDNYLVLYANQKLITMDDALVKASMVPAQTVALARRASATSRTPFFSVLLDQKLVTEPELQKLAYDLYRIPFRSIRGFRFDPQHKGELAAMVNEKTALDAGIIPLVKQEKVTLVGITTPSALLALGRIRENFLHLRFKAVFIPFSRFKSLFKQLYTNGSLPHGQPGRIPTAPPVIGPEIKKETRPRIITVTSGKGGAGKTNLSLNLALELARSNQRVCLFDADLGLANINILTGIHPENDLESVLLGTHTLDEIVIRNFQGIDIIPGSSGVERMADLTQSEAAHLIDAFLTLDRYDYFIFDTSAGISTQVLSFCMASHEILMVITPEPTSLTDAYALLKLLSSRQYASPVNVVVNQVKNVKAARNAYGQLRDTVNRFLKIDLFALGIVVADRHVPMSVIAQTPFLTLFPDAPASRCIRLVTRKLMARDRKEEARSLELFWHRCLNFLAENRSARDQERAQKSQPPAGAEKAEKSDQLTKGIQTRGMMDLLQGMENKISALALEIKAMKQLVAQGRSGETEKNASPEDPF